MTKIKKQLIAWLLILVISCSCCMTTYKKASAAAVVLPYITYETALVIVELLALAAAGYCIYDLVTDDEINSKGRAILDRCYNDNLAREDLEKEIKARNFEVIEGGKSDNDNGNNGVDPNDWNEILKALFSGEVFLQFYRSIKNVFNSEYVEDGQLDYEKYNAVNPYFGSVYQWKCQEFSDGTSKWYLSFKVKLDVRSSDIAVGRIGFYTFRGLTCDVSDCEHSGVRNHSHLLFYGNDYKVSFYSSGGNPHYPTSYDSLGYPGSTYKEYGLSIFDRCENGNSLEYYTDFMKYESFLTIPHFPTFTSLKEWVDSGTVSEDVEVDFPLENLTEPDSGYKSFIDSDTAVTLPGNITSASDLVKIIKGPIDIADYIGDPVTLPDIEPAPNPDPGTGENPGGDEGTDTDQDKEQNPDSDQDADFDQTVGDPEDYKISSAIISKFPFCIPFDLIETIKLLAADPEAPKFKWTFAIDSIDFSYDMDIDLMPFEPVAALCRWFFRLIFMVGLIMATRSLIKG